MHALEYLYVGLFHHRWYRLMVGVESHDFQDHLNAPETIILGLYFEKHSGTGANPNWVSSGRSESRSS